MTCYDRSQALLIAIVGLFTGYFYVVNQKHKRGQITIIEHVVCVFFLAMAWDSSGSRPTNERTIQAEFPIHLLTQVDDLILTNHL
jgi:hypothetical protein